MKKINGCLLVISALLISKTSFAFTDFIKLKRNGVTIFLGGDLHDSVANEINTKHATKFLRRISDYNQLAGEKGSSFHSKFYYELSEESALRIRKSTGNEGLITAVTFSTLAKSSFNDDQSLVIQLVPYEPRTLFSDQVSGYRAYLTSELYDAYAQSQELGKGKSQFMKLTPKYFNVKMNSLRPAKGNERMPTVQQYQEYVKTMIRNIESVEAKYKGSPDSKIFDKYREELTAGLATMTEMFGTIAPDTRMDTAIFKLIDASEKPLKRFHEIQTLLEQKVEFRFADAMFLDKLLTDIATNVKKPVTVGFIMGRAHSQALSTDLQSIGFEVHASVGDKMEHVNLGEDGAISTAWGPNKNLFKEMIKILDNHYVSAIKKNTQAKAAQYTKTEHKDCEPSQARKPLSPELEAILDQAIEEFDAQIQKR